jgi:hypothetical protein
MKDLQPAIDAEKIPSEQLARNFRLPPNIGEVPGRSTLLVGMRGCGKTMLLRTMRHTYPGVAVYGDLGRKILNALSADTGGAGLTFDTVTPTVDGLVQDKATCLLACWLAEQCQHQDIMPSFQMLRRILPELIRRNAPKDDTLLEWLQDNIYTSDLTSYRPSSDMSAFYDFAYDLATKAQSARGNPLLLLLDRAEEIPYPALVPVLALLDQCHPFLAMVACRPGILGPNPEVHPTLPVPGDHFDIKHIGYNPYTPDWRAFQDAVLNAWVPKALASTPSDFLDLSLKITRDGLRSTLDIIYKSIDEDGMFNKTKWLDAIMNSQTVLMQAVQGQLRRHNSDIPHLLGNIRRAKDFSLPVLLQFSANRQTTLTRDFARFSDRSKEDQLVRLGLRSGLFATRQGVTWHPYMSLDSVELQPIYIWKLGDIWR